MDAEHTAGAASPVCEGQSQQDSSAVPTDKRPCGFGGRFLTDETRVFEQNAWDNVQWSKAEEAQFMAMIEANSAQRMTEDAAQQLDDEAAGYWDKFYSVHQDRFFKDRHWLFTEFNELTSASRILEVGCGVGNTVVPLLQSRAKGATAEELRLFACDFSQRAVQLLSEAPECQQDGRCVPFVWDVANEDLPSDLASEIPENSLDVILLIFVLSALPPSQQATAVRRLSRLLRPGGLLLFRDYGRCDLAQVRFKPGRCLGDNLYARGDGTRVYFFSETDCHRLFAEEAGLTQKQLISDRRLIVNRAKQLKMYRVWVQAKYANPTPLNG